MYKETTYFLYLARILLQAWPPFLPKSLKPLTAIFYQHSSYRFLLLLFVTTFHLLQLETWHFVKSDFLHY